MHICIIAPPWLPVPAPAYGGTEAMLDQLARGLCDAGHHVRLIGHPDSTCPVERRSVVPASDVEPMGRGIVELEHVVGAYEMARDADVVHDHTTAGPLYAHRFSRLTVVTTNHGPFDRSANALYGAMVPRVGVVAISASQASTTDVPLDAIVPHGVAIDGFPFGDGRGGYVAFLGRMAPEKGAHRAIAAARAAGIPIVLAAKMREPGEIAYFEEFVRPELGPEVTYLGEIDAVAKLDLLAGAAALVNPISWPEPFGMVMLEALACGTPVVGFPYGAAPEIVEHGVSGLLVRNDEQLTRALGSLDRLDRAACRERARVFSVERMTNGYLRVFYRRRRRPAALPASVANRRGSLETVASAL